MKTTETEIPNENLILVYYIGIANVDNSMVEEYMNKFIDKIVLPVGNAILIPTPTSFDVRVECINPKYITDSELIKEHEKLMLELNNNLKNQLKIMKDDIQ